MSRRAAILTALATWAFGGAPPAEASQQAHFLVQHSAYELARPLDTSLSLTVASGPAPAKISVFAPVGYAAELPTAVGATVGSATLIVAPESTPLGPPSFEEGTIVVAGAAETDPAVQACSPGPHDAVWRIEPLGLPLLVDATREDDAALVAYRLELCVDSTPFDLPTGSRVLAALLMLEDVFRAPGVPGEYTWRAVVAPARVGEPGPDTAAAFELRSRVPLPYRMPVRARFEPARRSVLVRGTLSAVGKPLRGVRVIVAPFPETDEDTVVILVPADGPGVTRTTRTGTFATRLPLRRTGRLIVIAWPADRPCRAPPQAPRGCVLETTSPLTVGPFRVRVPR